MSDYKIFLNMIVKNESKVIERCLDAVSWIDGLVISDTGSTDNTIELIEEWRTANNKDGAVVQNEWKNFGHNRTEAILEGKKWCAEHGYDLHTVFFLFIDADMLFPAGSIRDIVHQADLWDVRQQNDAIIYSNLRLARASLDIVCVCPTHEYYDIRTPNATRKSFDDVVIRDIGDGGSKQDKAQRDIRLLKEALTTDPKNPRYWFYLANTYRDIRDYQNAILAYNQRIEIGGWYEELYCAIVYKGDCHQMIQQNPAAVECWLNAFNIDPERGEALIRLATLYRLQSKHATAMIFIDKGMKLSLPDRKLFQEKTIYDYRFLYELSICGYYVKDFVRGRMACDMLLKNENAPTFIHESVEKNKVFYLKKNIVEVVHHGQGDVEKQALDTLCLFKTPSSSLLSS